MVKKIFSDKTKELGAFMAKESYSLVYGGGKLGLMGDLARSLKKMVRWLFRSFQVI